MEYLCGIDMIAKTLYIIVGRRWIKEADHLKVGRWSLNVKVGGCTQTAAG